MRDRIKNTLNPENDKSVRSLTMSLGDKNVTYALNLNPLKMNRTIRMCIYFIATAGVAFVLSDLVRERLHPYRTVKWKIH